MLLAPVMAWSQKNHTVGPKETLFSIGRQYNVHPRELATYNNIAFESALTIGQVLKIPSKTTLAPLPTVITQQKTVTEILPKEKPVTKKEEKTAETGKLVPVYHKVQKKESLYQISRLFNKVPVDDLKKWNKLNSDALSEGTNLIVGYTQSAKEPVTIIKDEQIIKPVKTEVSVVEKKPAPITEKSLPPEKIIHDDPFKPKPVNAIAKDFNGGVFKDIFETQAEAKEKKEEEGSAGVFKSTSGWEDGKYYCLHNTVAAGTIIKVTNKENGKFIYAKVLDIMPDLTQNAGLVIRISNAASELLGAAEKNFNCILNYSK